MLDKIQFTYADSLNIPYFFLLISFLSLFIWSTVYSDKSSIRQETHFLSTWILFNTLVLVASTLDISGYDSLAYGAERVPLYEGRAPSQQTYVYSFTHRSQLTTYFEILILVTSIIVLLITPNYIDNNKINHNTQSYEYSLLIVFNVLAMFSLMSSYNFIMLYLSFELNAIITYSLISLKQNETALQAALKYFIVSCLSSLFFLLGFSIWYGLTGISDFEDAKLFIKLYKHLYW
jgi:NADH:ubiquinone oxidoreductase subunit 2 (subunit N)